MIGFEDLTLYGIAMAPVIAAVVELAKRVFGMPTKYAPLLAAALAVGVLWFGQYQAQNPEVVQSAQFWLGALILFLSTSGFYSVAKFGGERVKASRGPKLTPLYEDDQDGK